MYQLPAAAAVWRVWMIDICQARHNHTLTTDHRILSFARPRRPRDGARPRPRDRADQPPRCAWARTARRRRAALPLELGRVDAVALEQAPEVGAVEPGQPRGLRDRPLGALHREGEVVLLDRRARPPLGLGERRQLIVAALPGGHRDGRGDLAVAAR